MKGGSPAYDYHATEGFLNNESTHLSNMPLTIHETAPLEQYANLYQISGGGRKRRKRSSKRRASKRRASKRRIKKTSLKRRKRFN